MDIKNKIAGFWIRFTSRSIDIIIASIITVLMSMIFIDFNNLVFRADFLFYIWIILFMLIFGFFEILIPIINKGASIGGVITKTQIKSEYDMAKTMFMREAFFSLSWIFIMILIMMVINHTLIIDYLSSENNAYTDIEQLRITIVTTFSGLISFIQLMIGISVIVNNDGKSFHDRYSKSIVIYKNIFLEDPSEGKDIIKPIKVRRSNVEWVE